MKSFDALPAPCRSFLLFWMFTLLVAELYLLVRNTIQRAPQGRYPLSIFMIGAHLFFCKSSPRATAALWPCPGPGGVGDILVSALRLYRAFPQEKRRVAATLSARSMIEAHGRSAHGGLLFRPEGPGDAVQQHHGGPSQPAHRGLSPGPGELTAAIENPPEPVRPELEGCLRFPDGSVYRFTGTDLTVDGEPGWYQLMAQNVTEQVEINRQLARQNEKLKKTNGRLQKNV